MQSLRINTGKIKGNKRTISALSLILIMTMSLMMAFTQSSFAQVGVPQPVKTAGYISVAPTTIGVGQEATVNLWTFPMPTNYLYRPYYKGFEGITVTFIKPDGSKDTFMPVSGTGQFDAGQTESLGGIYFYYAPDMAGDWSVSFTMPAQNLTDSTGTVLYQACTSMTAYFTVQTEPVLAGMLNGYPWGELPDDDVYWSYPINSNNRDWSTISGYWLGGSATSGTVNGPGQKLWNPYGTGPNTGHIVWKQTSYRAGGIIGGDYGSLSYGAQGSVIGFTIMGGKLYANVPNAGTFECIDLQTGEVLYTANGTISSGLHLPSSAYIQSGYDASVVLDSSYGRSPTAYLYGTSGTTWNYYDPNTGALMRSISNCSSARLIDGSNLAYGIRSGSLFRWNYSKVTNNNWPTGIEWTKAVPTPLGANAISLFGVEADAIVLYSRNEFWGYSAETGASLWNLTLNYPVNANQEFCLQGVPYFIVLDPVAATFKCYSMLTGGELWESDSFSDSAWATTWTVYWSATNDYENLYAQFPDGTMHAYSLTDGHEVWRSEAIASTEYTNNAVPYVCSMVMIDGKLYGFAGYSSQYKINPIPRFALQICINATNGDTLYTLNGGIRSSAAANGYVIGTGDFDGNLYCVGKGQTSTSITIQNDVVANHATVLIKGNVLDQSPAQAGTPAVADSSMSEWMDYLHMQNATLLNNPPQPTGVPVTLTAVDPNGNTISVGTTTTDSKGNYAINFAPENVGMYTITAAFAGTNSYYPSDSETQLSVIAAPETTPTSTPIANPPYELYTIGSAVAIIAAIAIVALLLLRKRP